MVLKIIAGLRNLHGRAATHGDLTLRNILIKNRTKELKLKNFGSIELSIAEFALPKLEVAKEPTPRRMSCIIKGSSVKRDAQFIDREVLDFFQIG